MTRYLSGLCVAGLGLCGGGWLVVAAVAFGGESAGRAGRVNLLTGAVLIAVCCLSLVCWSLRSGGSGCAPTACSRTGSRWSHGGRRGGTGGRSAGTSGAPPGSRSGRPAAPGAPPAVRPGSPAAARSARAACLARASRSASRRPATSRTARAGSSERRRERFRGLRLGPRRGQRPWRAPGERERAARTGLTAAAANGTSVNGTDAHGKGGSDPGVSGAGANPGERAAELISELRSMLEPLLAATGGQPALAEQLSLSPGVLLAGQPASAAFPGGQTATARRRRRRCRGGRGSRRS